MLPRVHTLTNADSAQTAIVRLIQIGASVCVTAQCRCGAKVLPPFPVEDGLSERVVIDAAAMIAAEAQRNCGTPEEAPGCRQKRENLAQPVGRNRPKIGPRAGELAGTRALTHRELMFLRNGQEVTVHPSGVHIIRGERIIPVDPDGQTPESRRGRPK